MWTTCLYLFIVHVFTTLSLKQESWKNGKNTLHCKHMACTLLLRALTVTHLYPCWLLPSSSFPSFILPSAFSPCPVTEPSVWTDCDIGCVGDRLADVISEGEKNRSASLYLTPSPTHQTLMKEGLTRDTVVGNVSHLFFKRWLSLSKGLFEFKVS